MAPDTTPAPEEQHRQWDRVAAGWATWWPTIEAAARPVSQRMLELAGVGPGQRVLDIATGYGEPALMAAERVGPTGRVLATDVSARMLDIARDRAARSGAANVDFRQVDGDRMDFADRSFEAVLCRWGVTSLADPAQALATIRRTLTPGGAFATAVWKDGAEGRPLATVATALVEEMFDAPTQAPQSPGTARSSLGDAFAHAGFVDVRVENVAMPLEWASAAACAQYMLDVSPDLAALFLDRPPADRTRFSREFAGKLQPWVASDGSVRVRNVAICVAGRTPGNPGPATRAGRAGHDPSA